MPGEEEMIMIGNFIPPQFKNEQGKWELVRGQNGSYLVTTPIEVSDEPFNGTGNLTKEFTSEMTGIEVSNDSVPNTPGAADLTFTIDGKTRTVKAGEVRTGRYKPFTTITINSTVPWRAEGIQTIAGFTSEVDITPPDNVTNLTVTNLTATNLTLHWTASASSDCVGYDIYRGSTLITSLTGRTVTTCNVDGLTQNTQYTFSVRARDATGNIALGNTSGSSTTVTTSTTADTTPPENVTNPRTTNLTQSGVTLGWDASVSSDVASYDVYNGTTFLGNTTSLTYNINGLSPLTDYYFYVKAKDTSGNVSSGTQFNVTTIAQPTDTTPPTVTASPAAGTYSSAQSVTLTGSDNSGGTVTIYYTADGSTPTQSSLVYNGTPISVPATATIKFFGKDPSGNVSAVQSISYVIDIAPNPVTGLSATTASITTNSVPLKWTVSSSGNVANQEVAFSSNGGTSYTVASAVINPSSNSYTVTGLTPGTSYIFRVVAINGYGTRSTAVTTTATTTADVTPPQAVTNLAAGTPTSNSIPITWTASVTPSVKYEVSYSADGGANYTIATSNVTGTSYTLTGLAANTPYKVKVAVLDASNNRSTGNPTVTATTATGSADTLTNLKTSVLTTAQSGYNIHPDYHFGVIKILVDGTANKFFLAVRDDGTAKYGIYCDGTNVMAGWVENGVLRKELATVAKPTGDFYVELAIPGSYLPGHFDNQRGYLKAFVWASSGAKPGSYNLSGQLQNPTTKWTASSAKTLGTIIIPTTANGYYYKCTTAGTNGATEPTWPTTENGTVTDGTVTWTCYKIVPQVNASKVNAYSLDGTSASIKELTVGDGLNVINPLRAQGNFIGRWFPTFSNSNTGVILGEEMATTVHGSEILIKFSGTTTLKMMYANSAAHWLAVSIDGGPLTRLGAVNPTNPVSGSTYTTPVVTLVSGLTTGQHTARIVVAAMDTSADKWTTLGSTVRFKGFSGDDGNFVVSPWNPAKKRVLFIGDSITDGLNGMYGAIGGNSQDSHAGDRTYAKIAANQLNIIAETHGFGATGILNGGNNNVPKAIDNVKEWYGTKKEEFIRPDIIVIAHHTNSGIGTDADFIAGYKELIDWVRAKWNNVPIFLLEVSSWGTRRLTLPTIASSYTSGVTFIGTVQEGITISAPLDTIHPDETGHTQIGTHLATRITGILGSGFFVV